MAAGLAEKIAALGPEHSEHVAARIVEPEPERRPTPRRSFVAGQVVMCKVHGSAGPCTITEVGTGRNRGRIKIAGIRGWCPETNFASDEV
jgi:hypothetical protein